MPETSRNAFVYPFGAFSFSGAGQMGLVFPAKGGPSMTVAYGNLLGAEPYGFPPARERPENEKALLYPFDSLGPTGHLRHIFYHTYHRLTSRALDCLDSTRLCSATVV